MVQLVQLLALADERVVELLDDAAAVDGVEGAVEAQAQARRSQGLDEDVVEEREAADEVVGGVRFRGGDEEGATVSARTYPGFERALLRVETGGVGQDEGAPLAFEPAWTAASVSTSSVAIPAGISPAIRSRVLPQTRMFAILTL